jgi:hypothetical protein
VFKLADSILTTVNVVASIWVVYLSITNSENKRTLGWLSIAGVTVLTITVLQFITDYRSRWKAHEFAAISYSSLRRRMERAAHLEDMDERGITEFEQSIEHVRERAPAIPFFLWDWPKDITDRIRELRDQNYDENLPHFRRTL